MFTRHAEFTVRVRDEAECGIVPPLTYSHSQPITLHLSHSISHSLSLSLSPPPPLSLSLT
jgi:hypothetical protein